jgi:uncharacterized membrane protein YhaH (DUF805 family)
MSFTDAIKSGFDNYVNFNGRASRPAFWWWVLFAFLVGIAANIIDAAINSTIISVLTSLALLLPGLAVSVRRLHDTNRSGWWILISLIPIVGIIVLIVFWVQESDAGSNQHGPAPAA